MEYLDMNWLFTLPTRFLITAAYFLVGFLVVIILRNVVKRAVKAVDDGNDEVDTKAEKRAKTLAGLLNNFVGVAIWGVVITMSLSRWGVNIAPILTGAGVLGLAVGFGAQTLVKDIVTGFFILFEDQYNVGDSVEIAGVTGEVLAINLRTTILRGENNKIHIIPNSKIDKITKEI